MTRRSDKLLLCLQMKIGDSYTALPFCPSADWNQQRMRSVWL